MNDSQLVILCKVLPGPVIDDSGDFEGDDGKPVKWSTRKQEAVVTVGEFKYPYRVRLEGEQLPYPAGDYYMDMSQMFTVAKKSHYLGKFTKLLPVPAASK
ncbi:MAG: single-stranded DNA-binding protein [Cypionkella sp.]